ncbi:hypothetical protein LTR49_025147 [Elasticomyces elasticus]|nr:hypothetical protein LTR49_025147 [Elasticomyces elasticus]
MARSAAGDEHVGTTHFPFFELPRELRDRIYQMVFQFPRSGLFFSSLAIKKLIVRSCDLEDDSSFDHVIQDHESRSHIPETSTVPDILSPLLANRQFYREAMPLFYSLNSFDFGCQRTMSTVIARLLRAFREHVRSVGVRYDPRRTYMTNMTRGAKYDEVWFQSLE